MENRDSQIIKPGGAVDIALGIIMLIVLFAICAAPFVMVFLYGKPCDVRLPWAP